MSAKSLLGRCEEIPFESYGDGQVRLGWWDRKGHFRLRVADWPRVEIYSIEPICR